MVGNLAKHNGLAELGEHAMPPILCGEYEADGKSRKRRGEAGAEVMMYQRAKDGVELSLRIE